MGCSYTEGVGCWDMDTIPKEVNRTNVWDKKYSKMYESNVPNFHEKGWPNKLGKKLGYDKVINLGLSGSSTSGQMKIFMEKHKELLDTEKYDILIIWLLTEPSRFSFYGGGTVKSILPTKGQKNNDIGSSYLNFIDDVFSDPILEQIFYIKTFINVCENNDYGLIITYWEHFTGDILLNQFNSPYFLYNKPHHVTPPWPYQDPYTSKICPHPNENGYELISENIYKGIVKNHSKYILENKSKTFEWVWDGNPIYHDINYK